MGAVASEVLNLPNQPMFARAGDGEFYRWEGKALVRVTSVVDMFTGGHLPNWYANMAATEDAELVYKFERGELPFEELCEMVKDVNARATAAIRYRDHKGAIGTLTHHGINESLLGLSLGKDDYIDYFRGLALKLGKADPDKDRGAEPYSLTLARETRHYFSSLRSWWDRALDAGVTVNAIGLEAMMISRTYTYAGTADLFCDAPTKWLRQEVGDKFPDVWRDHAIVGLCGDYKTSNQLNVTKIRLQTAGYTNADHIGLIAAEGREGSLVDVPPTQGAFALHVKAFEGKPGTGCQMALWADEPEDFEAFLSLRHAYGHLYERPMQNPRRRSATPKPPKRNPLEAPF